MTAKLRWGAAGWVGAWALLCFLRAVAGGFVNFDDDRNILNNPHFRGLSLSHLQWMFTNLDGLYMPLTWLSLGVDYAIWGMRPAGYHLTNVLLHTLAAVLVYLLILRLLGPEQVASVWGAAAGAIVWAIHPLRVESVAWVTERRDVLSGVFVALTLIAYLRAAAGDRPGRWLAVSAGCFALSLLSKAMAILLPVILLAIDVYPLRRLAVGWRRLLLEKVPYALLSAAALIVAFAAQQKAEALHEAPPGLQFIQPGYRLCFYLWKMIAPVALSPLYQFRAGEESPYALKYVLGAIGAIAVTVALIAARRRWPAGLVAWIAFVAVLAPTLGIPQVGPHFAADRYTYLAAVPFSALLGAGMARLLAARHEKRLPEGVWPLVPTAFATVAVLLALLTIAQISVWRDSETLWTHVVSLDDRNHMGWYNRGSARLEARRAREALEDFDRAIHVAPGIPRLYNNRGYARRELGNRAGALEDFSTAIRLDSRMAEAYANRALVHEDAGDLRAAIGDSERALEVAPLDWPWRAAVTKNLEDLRRRIR